MFFALLSLPNEILLQIVNDIDDVPCYTIESVSQSCKTLHTLASKRLHQHLRRKRKYSSIAIGHFDMHPFVPLKAFLADPDFALYVKTLEVGSFERSDKPNSRELTRELEDKLVSTTLDVRQRLNLESHPDFMIPSTWSRAILSGDPDAAAALLISVVPNICKLRLVDPSRYLGTLLLSPILDTLLQRASNEVHETDSLNSFHNLCEVELRGAGYWWWSSGGNGCWTKFGAIPSLQKIRGRRIGPGFRHITSTSANPSPKSNVISLEFDEGLVNAATFDTWLYDIKALQVFTYKVRAESREISAACHPMPIVKTLQLHTFKSLISLELTGFANLDITKCQHAELFIGSLDAFEVLSHIRLESIVLCRIRNRHRAPLRRERILKHGANPQDKIDLEDTYAARHKLPLEYQCLMDILPASAKQLRLIGKLSTDDATKLLSKSTSTTLLPSERCLPNLVTIFLEDCEPFGELKCKQSGFILEFGKRRALEHKARLCRVMTDVAGRITDSCHASTRRLKIASRPLLSERAVNPPGRRFVARHQRIANK